MKGKIIFFSKLKELRFDILETKITLFNYYK